MAEFLEERLPVCVAYGASVGQQHAVQITKTAGGNEYRRLLHPYVQLSYDVSYLMRARDVREQVFALYERANGAFRGFRVKDFKDFTTNNYVDPPTALDQPLVQVSVGVYQLMRWYGDPQDAKCARRRLRKPLAGSVTVGVGGAAYPAGQWSVDNTTGLVALAANKSRSITAISKAAAAVLDVGSNTFVVGESVAITGAVGMTQINGKRALIAAKPSSTQITVAINSTDYSTWTSGGTVQTWPLSGEAVTGGCEFDVPCRFDADLDATFSNLDIIDASGIAIVEILNP